MARVRGAFVVGVMACVAALGSACQSTPEAPRVLPFPSNAGPPQVIPLRSPVPIYIPPSGYISSGPPSASPSPRRPAGLFGCGFVSQREAETAAGTALDAGTQTGVDAMPPVMSHTGCSYRQGASTVEYDVYVFDSTSSRFAFEQGVWAGLGKPGGGVQIGIETAPGVTYATTVGGRQYVVLRATAFDVVVVTASQVKAGAAVAVAGLMARRM